MVKLFRGQHGKFITKSDEYRQVRSLRLTDSAWEALGTAAELQSMTRAGLIENLAEQSQAALTELALQQIKRAADKVIDDPQVTRNGKDKGAVKRALEALLNYLD